MLSVDIDQDIYKVKLKVAWNEKRKKLCGFWSILPEQKVERKPLFFWRVSYTKQQSTLDMALSAL